MATVCAKTGATLILSARREKELDELAAELKEGAGSSALSVLPLDVTDHEAVERKTAEAHSLYGRIDILINNAGISQRSLTRDLSYGAADTVIRTDLLGAIDLTLAVLRYMYEARRGHIVVTSSVMGKLSTPYRSAYCAAKFGLHGFFSSLAAESRKDNIDVTVLVPGRVRTDIAKNALTGSGERHGITDSGISRGMPADKAALLALAAIARRKFEYSFALTPLLRVGLFLDRMAPALYRKLVSRIQVT